MIKRLLKKKSEVEEKAADEVFVHLNDDNKSSGDGAVSSPLSNNTTNSSIGHQTEKTLDALSDRVVIKLLESGLVTRDNVRAAVRLWTQKGKRQALWRTFIHMENVDDALVYGTAADVYSFPRIELTSKLIDDKLVKSFVDSLPPRKRLRLLELQLLPIRSERDQKRKVDKLIFASYDPARTVALKFMQELNLHHFEIYYTPKELLVPIFQKLFPPRNEYLERLAESDTAGMFDLQTTVAQDENTLVDQEALDAEINRSALINLFEASLLEAVRVGASDIHIFPNQDGNTEFHFRIDGKLQLWHAEDKVHPESIIAVAKDRCSNIDRFEREAAQDGFIQRSIDNTLIRYRVSILPLASVRREIKAESIVIRVLDDRNVLTGLGGIGIDDLSLKRFETAIRQPHGMVIMTGPTGSGKSTSLLAALTQVRDPAVNILTIEDPVEYMIDGIRQIKLGPRLHLEEALKSVLRHDPDIVMVGEMRDKHTAELAIKLANTGHLTFSTLHTNDAPSAVSRLYKMGIEPFLIAYAINLVVAQRLVRKLCNTCKLVDEDSDILMLEQLGFSSKEIKNITFYKASINSFCEDCLGVGYKGRRAIAEAMHFSRRVRRIIVDSKEMIDEGMLRSVAIEEGMRSLTDSAREVIKNGETAPEEAFRVLVSE